MDRTYDILIAGGGAAGLSLAYRLARSSLSNQKILIVDQEAKKRNDRTWCFWSDQATPFDGIIHKEWRQLQVVSNSSAQTLDLGDYRYQMIRGDDFYRFIHQELAGHANIEFLQGRVEQIEDGPRAARVAIDGQVYKGRWVFSSIFDLRQFNPAPSYRYLEQRFMGWEIETDRQAFVPSSATFFDFRAPQREALNFFYVLPFSGNRALVEGVSQLAGLCSRRSYPLAPGLRSYVEKTLGIKDYRITAKEGGATPLTDWPFPRQLGQRIMTVGVPGGQVKPTSGYAFSRIQHDSDRIVRSLIHQGHPFDVPVSPWIYRFCDTLLLQMMLRQRETVIPTFVKMFQSNPIERIFRFLDERSSPWENTRLMASLAQPAMIPAFFQTQVMDQTLQEA